VVGAAARFPDEEQQLIDANADVVVDFYEDVGHGLAENLLSVSR